MTNTPTHPLKQTDFGILGFANYKGCLIQKIIGGYIVLNTTTNSEEGVDRIIEQAGKHLSKSILNDGCFECTNTEK